MIKNKVKLESILENRVGHFILDNDCPVDVAEKFLLAFMQFLGKIKEQQKAQEEAQNKEKENQAVPSEAQKE